MLFRDELTGWLRSLDKQGREGDRAFYLEAWNGTNSYTVDRVGRGTIHLPAICLSVFGGIQPGPLSTYVYQTARGGIGDDGLLQRFQLAVWPDAPHGWKNVDRWPDSSARTRVHDIFEALDQLELSPGEDDIPAIQFAPDAQELFDEWRGDLEIKLRSDELPSEAIESHLAKYRSLMPSLALLFQLVADMDAAREPAAVSLENAAQAAEWCAYLESHALRLYASAEDPAMAGGRELLKKASQGRILNGSSARDIYRKHWSRLNGPEEVNGALRVAEEYGWVRQERDTETGGRDVRWIFFHPEVFPK